MMRSGRSRHSTGLAARGTNVMRVVVGAQVAVAAWRETIVGHMPRPRDDRGAITVEMAIIVGILSVAALGLATYLASTVIPNFQNEIPSGPGG